MANLSWPIGPATALIENDSVKKYMFCGVFGSGCHVTTLEVGYYRLYREPFARSIPLNANGSNEDKVNITY